VEILVWQYYKESYDKLVRNLRETYVKGRGAEVS